MSMNDRQTAQNASILASCCLAVLAVFPASAAAEPRKPAPITFASAGATAKTVNTPDAPAERPVSGKVFYPAANAEYDREGMATLIAADLAGMPTANGETYDRNMLSAAHPTLPLPSLVHITNKQTGQETVVRVNDRGPIAGGGLIELSDRAANAVGLGPRGEGRVRVRYLGPAPIVSEPPAPIATPQAPPEPASTLKKSFPLMLTETTFT
ncbi:MAG: septal ring lytic transglycosylase RlpA family protein, partial [Pseudomonadota bacterium]